VTRLQSSAPAEHWRTFDAEAQRLATALRAGRLTVLVGAAGVGKTTLLVAGVLPLLRRRVGDQPHPPESAPQVTLPLPDRRGRTQSRDHRELLHFVDQWHEAPLDSLARALDDQPAAARARLGLAEAMSPAHLSALSQRHGGASLLFVFDHFELLVEGARHNRNLQRFVDAWAAAVRAPDLDVHFLVAVDAHAWHRMQALRASISEVKLQTFSLQARPGRQVLELLTQGQSGDDATKPQVSDADFLAAFNASLSRVATSAREAGLAKQQALVGNLGGWIARSSTAMAPAPDPGEHAQVREAVAEVAARAAAAAEEAERHADARLRAEAERHAGVEATRLAETQKLTQALAAAEAAVQAAEDRRRAEAQRHADTEATRLAETQKLTQALAAAEAAVQAAEDRRRAEAQRHGGVEATRLAETQKLTQALAAAEAAVQAAEDRRRAEAERHAGVEDAGLAEARRLVHALAAAEAAATREAQARQAAEANARRAAEGQQRAQRDVRVAAPATSLPGSTGTADPASGLLAPAVASAWPVRQILLGVVALLLIAAAVVLWWLPQPAPSVDLSAKLPVLAPPPTSPAVAESARYAVLAASTDGSHGAIERELAGALSTAATAVPVVAAADGSDVIAGLRAPARLAIARFDALRAARGSAGPPLRVLTALFPVEVLFIVRADSPLRHIRDLRGRRLNIGPVQGDGSHSVREMVRRLVGTEMPEPAQFDNDQALAELVAFRSIDAMAIVEPQPSAWWAALDPRTARRLRLLTLDTQNAADRKLLTALGMSESRTGVSAAKGKTTTTPAVMTFLVASGEGDADVDRLTAMARALCRELPRLRKHGHPKWRSLQPATPLDTGWPVVRPFQSVLSRCARS